MDHEHGWKRRARIGRNGQVGPNVAGGTSERHILDLEPRIVGRNDLRLRIVAREHRYNGRCGSRASRKFRELRHEAAAIQRKVGVLVIEADHLLGDFRSIVHSHLS